MSHGRRQLIFSFGFLLILLLNASIAYSQDAQERSISTSIAGMEQLLMSEKILINTVERYVEELQAKVNSLKNLVTVLKTENDKALQDPEKYLHNPLNGFSLIRRMHNDWNNIELFMAKPVGESYIEVIKKYRHEMPTTNDISEASEAIHRLQTTYDMKIDDVVKGILNGKQYDAKLSAVDCYFMGLHLFAKKSYYQAGFWLYNAIELYENSDYNKIIDYGLDKPNALYGEVLVKQLRFNDALIVLKKASSLRPNDAALLSRKNEIELQTKTYTGAPISYPKPNPTAYEKGCRGQYVNIPSNLYCIYNTTTSAFLRLAPLKMELLQLEPYMVLFHDIISDKEILDLQKLARPNLKRATVFSKTEGKSQIVEKRTSKFSWFQDNTSQTTIRLNQRIRDMTGFDIEGSEMLQVMNYGLGGHYDTHFDYFNVSDTADIVKLNGNRIATVLFYMSDVEQGGATVFPNIRTAVFPRKGTAVMWYNLDNKVEGDWRTLHAACPVIVGSKWVCNKWIRSKAQIFRKPCYI
ncbi:prolyl 4-hydroxylase subunit alpha-1-like [Musca autumnalis]|uniref:prolyl 4-hydroxylase subunit alpha-1-like n=1 Tax=Musca autumnalis TaxID=221902 RepID=UPI003CE7DFB3